MWVIVLGMAPVDTSIGQRLKAARMAKHLRQEDLAERSGVSLANLRKIEQGQRQGSLSTLTRLANAMGASVNDILGVQPGLGGDAAPDVTRVRVAIYDRSADVEPDSLDDLQTRLGDLRSLYWHARYGVLAHELPDHLAQARSAVRAATDAPSQRAAQALLAESLNVTASLVTHLAQEDLAHVALMQARDAAQAAEDRLLLASQQSTTAWVLSRQGLWQQAQRLAAEAAAEIEPVLSKAPAEQIGLWGEMLHFGLVALAREGRQDEAHELLGLVQAAGRVVGHRGASAQYGLKFSDTFAAHSAVQLAQATDQPRQALEAAERVENPGSLPPSIHARYLLNVAWAATLEWKSVEALAALKKIEQIAPEMLAHHGLAKAIVEDLIPRRSKERLPGLSRIAELTQVHV